MSVAPRRVAVLLALGLGGCALFVRFDDPAQGEAGGVAGGAAACAEVRDCPGEDSLCRKIACVRGQCAANDLPDGTRVPDEDAGNCLGLACKQGGEVVAVQDDSDVLGSPNPCQQNECKNGALIAGYAGAQTACGSGATHCDGKGDCVGCAADHDCPQATACASYGCDADAGRCVLQQVADGTLCGGSSPTCADATTVQNPSACRAGACQPGTKAPCGGKGAMCMGGACLGGEKKIGEACASPGECLDGHCVDGFCCDTVCGGACEACSNAKKQAKSGDGMCGASADKTSCGTSCSSNAETDLVCLAGACQSAGKHYCPTGCGANGHCAACAVNANCNPFKCEDNSCCASCSQSIMTSEAPPPCSSSKPYVDDLKTCGCTASVCAVPCSTSCATGVLSSACLACVSANCATQVAACMKN